MTAVEIVLDEDASYARFRIAMRVMHKVLAAAPAPVGSGELERLTGYPARMVASVCANLLKTGMLSSAAGGGNNWLPGPSSKGATLADILCCEIAHRTASCAAPAQALHANSARRHDLDALLLQATMKINQTILEQLRQFPLEKLDSKAEPAT